MWLFVQFDLPTTTIKERKAYTRFRKYLIDDGFTMLQYSTYTRHCASRENLQVHKKRIKQRIPAKGEVILFEMTDKQFGMMEFFKSAAKTDTPDTPQQLELF